MSDAGKLQLTGWGLTNSAAFDGAIKGFDDRRRREALAPVEVVAGQHGFKLAELTLHAEQRQADPRRRGQIRENR